MSNKEISRRTFFKVALTGTAAVVLNSACNRVFGATPVGAVGRTPDKSPTPSRPNTPYPTEVQPPTITPEPSETPAPSETPTPEDLDWNYVSRRSDEEIFNRIGIPNPEDYSLSEELSPNKILRNEGGQSYALFQNPEGITLLAENLETRMKEHAIYTEHENGVPLMIITDKSVVEKDGGWFKLNEDYPASDAQDRLSESFNRGLSFNWWAANHPEDFKTRAFPSVDGIFGFQVTDRDLLTKNQRRQISDYFLQSFKGEVQTARENNSPLVLNFPDRNKAQFDAAKDTLVAKAVLTGSITPNWQEIADGFLYNRDIRNVTSDKNGSFVYLYIKQPAFMPTRDVMRPVGGFMTAFTRYFFGSRYYGFQDNLFKQGFDNDITGPILENMCQNGSISESLLYFSNKIYPFIDNARLTTPTNGCAVKFGN